MVATTRINQNKPASLSATGPSGFRMEGEFPPQPAKRSEDKNMAERSIPQRFIPRKKGILITSHSPEKIFDDGQERHLTCGTLSTLDVLMMEGNLIFLAITVKAYACSCFLLAPFPEVASALVWLIGTLTYTTP